MMLIEYDERFDRQVMRLHRIAMEEIGAYKGDGPWNDDLKNIRASYCDSGGCFLLLVENDEVSAMGAYRRIDDRTAEIKRMRVQPSMQGKGIGGIMLNELERRAKTAGYTSLILETSSVQERANRLYVSKGFVKERIEDIDGYECTWYRKSLV